VTFVPDIPVCASHLILTCISPHCHHQTDIAALNRRGARGPCVNAAYINPGRIRTKPLPTYNYPPAFVPLLSFLSVSTSHNIIPQLLAALRSEVLIMTSHAFRSQSVPTESLNPKANLMASGGDDPQRPRKLDVPGRAHTRESQAIILSDSDNDESSPNWLYKKLRAIQRSLNAKKIRPDTAVSFP
jgi:hypothetical protein